MWVWNQNTPHIWGPRCQKQVSQILSKMRFWCLDIQAYEILCLTKAGIWTAFTYLVIAFWKKGISEISVRFGATRRYLMCDTFPFEARLRYLPLAPKDCLSMEVGRRYLTLAYKKSCVVFLLNNLTLRYPPLPPKDLFFMEVTEVTCLWHKHFLALSLMQEADCNI